MDRTFIAVDVKSRRYIDSRQHHNIITLVISHDPETGRYSLWQAEHGKADIGCVEDWEPADPVGLWDVTIGGDLVDCGAEAARMLSRLLLKASGQPKHIFQNTKS